MVHFPSLPKSPLPLYGLLITTPVGLAGGIRWLPGYLHRHSQFLCHRTEPSDLLECDIPASSVGRQCRCQWRSLLPIWVDPAGTLVPLCDDGNGLFMR